MSPCLLFLCELDSPSACFSFSYRPLSVCLCLYVCQSRRLSVCLSLRLFCLCQSVCLFLFVSLSVCLSVCLPTCLSVYLPACLPACLSVCLSVCLSLSLSVYLSVFVFVVLKHVQPNQNKCVSSRYSASTAYLIQS